MEYWEREAMIERHIRKGTPLAEHLNRFTSMDLDKIRPDEMWLWYDNVDRILAWMEAEDKHSDHWGSAVIDASIHITGITTGYYDKDELGRLQRKAEEWILSNLLTCGNDIDGVDVQWSIVSSQVDTHHVPKEKGESC